MDGFHSFRWELLRTGPKVSESSSGLLDRTLEVHVFPGPTMPLLQPIMYSVPETADRFMQQQPTQIQLSSGFSDLWVAANLDNGTKAARGGLKNAVAEFRTFFRVSAGLDHREKERGEAGSSTGD